MLGSLNLISDRWYNFFFLLLILVRLFLRVLLLILAFFAFLLFVVSLADWRFFLLNWLLLLLVNLVSLVVTGRCACDSVMSFIWNWVIAWNVILNLLWLLLLLSKFKIFHSNIPLLQNLLLLIFVGLSGWTLAQTLFLLVSLVRLC